LPYSLICRKRELFLERNKFISFNAEIGKKKKQQQQQRQQQQKFTVAIAYHVGMVNNWKVIVYDQMNTLKLCGLSDTVDRLMISYSNGDKTDLDKVLYLESFGDRKTIKIVEVYEDAEFWLGNWEGLDANQEHHANLNFNTDNLYEHVIKPEQYILLFQMISSPI